MPTFKCWKTDPMIKKLPNSNIISAVLVASSMALGVHNTAQAQSITLYRTGVIVPPTYSKISDAISAALSGDSLVLSPHTFKENNLVIGKDLKLTGTSDTSAVSIIDAELKNRAILINNGSVYIKDLVPLYVQNINNVNRETNQTESFKLIIKL